MMSDVIAKLLHLIVTFFKEFTLPPIMEWIWITSWIIGTANWYNLLIAMACLLMLCEWGLEGRAVRGLLLIKEAIVNGLLGILCLGWFLLYSHWIFRRVILGYWGWGGR